MKVEIFSFDREITKGKLEHNIVPTHMGYIEYDGTEFTNDDAEKCWHLCNWMHWAEEKPANLFSELCSCDHGVCFKANEVNWLALSNGWLSGTSVEIVDYVARHKNDIFWDKE